MSVHGDIAGPEDREVILFLEDVPPGRSIMAVWLVDPAGARYPAIGLSTIQSEGPPRDGGSRPGLGIGVGVHGGSSSGVHPRLGLSLGLLGQDEARRSRRVRARVPIPDAAAFRREAARWHVRVEVKDVTGEERVLRFPIGLE